MAMIDNLIEDHFSFPQSTDVSALLATIDARVDHVGSMAKVIFDLAVHPTHGQPNPDMIAAAVNAQLLLIGQLGREIDAVEAMIAKTLSPRPRAAA